jgi:ANTAR domain
VGLPIPQRVVGAINLYSSAANPPDQKSMAWVQGFAVYAGVALTNAALYASTAELADQMRAAMKSRAVIEQAKGILMARTTTTPLTTPSEPWHAPRRSQIAS